MRSDGPGIGRPPLGAPVRGGVTEVVDMPVNRTRPVAPDRREIDRIDEIEHESRVPHGSGLLWPAATRSPRADNRARSQPTLNGWSHWGQGVWPRISRVGSRKM